MCGRGHIFALDNAADLRFETHVKHAIGFVQDKVLDELKRYAATLDEIDKTTGGSNEQVTTTLDLSELRSDVGTSIYDTGPNPGAVGELSGLFVDLRDQLTSGCQDQGGGVSLSLAEALTLLHRRHTRAILESL